MSFWNINNSSAAATIVALDAVKVYFSVLLNMIPEVGGVLSSILGLLMPGSSTQYLFEQLKEEMEKFVNEKIEENDWNLLDGRIREILTKMATMKDLLANKDYEGAHTLYQDISSFIIGEEENFKIKDYEFFLLPLFCTFVSQVAAFRFECIFNGDQFNLTNDEINREKLLLQELIYGTSSTSGVLDYVFSFSDKGKITEKNDIIKYNEQCTNARIYNLSCLEVIQSILDALPAELKKERIDKKLESTLDNSDIDLYKSQIYYVDASPTNNESSEIEYWKNNQKTLIDHFNTSFANFPLEDNLYMKDFKLYANGSKIIVGWSISYYDSDLYLESGDIEGGSVVSQHTFTKEKQPISIEMQKSRFIPNPSSSDRMDLRIAKISLLDENGNGILYSQGNSDKTDLGDPIIFSINSRRIITLNIYSDNVNGVYYGIGSAFLYVAYPKENEKSLK